MNYANPLYFSIVVNSWNDFLILETPWRRMLIAPTTRFGKVEKKMVG